MAVLLHDGQGVVQVSRTVAKVNCSETRRMDGSSVVRQIHLMVTVLSHFKLTHETPGISRVGSTVVRRNFTISSHYS